MAKTLDFMPGVETRKVSRPALESPSSSSLAAALLGAPDDRRAITIAAPAMIPAGVVAPCDATIAAMTRPITMIATFVPPPLLQRVCVGLTAGAGAGVPAFHRVSTRCPGLDQTIFHCRATSLIGSAEAAPEASHAGSPDGGAANQRR